MPEKDGYKMISNTVLEQIKDLTKKDKKTLSQKALKVSEEVGELSKVILPFDNAHSTTHRFIAKENILEEVVDTFLASISIAYELGFSDDDIEKMIVKKLTKWADLQYRGEDVGDKPIPYEIHVTVNDVGKQHFIDTCKKLNVKPIILDLQSKDGDGKFKDVMTSSVFFGDNRGAWEYLNRISTGLKDAGINGVREKIEAVPWHPGDAWMPSLTSACVRGWHPAAPRAMLPNCYA